MKNFSLILLSVLCAGMFIFSGCDAADDDLATGDAEFEKFAKEGEKAANEIDAEFEKFANEAAAESEKAANEIMDSIPTNF